jgi:RNA recognition motif-containing protein
MTPPEVRLAREKERELKELERATRTVFAFNLNIKADERDIFEFFAKAGEVRLGQLRVRNSGAGCVCVLQQVSMCRGTM